MCNVILLMYFIMVIYYNMLLVIMEHMELIDRIICSLINWIFLIMKPILKLHLYQLTNHYNKLFIHLYLIINIIRQINCTISYLIIIFIIFLNHNFNILSILLHLMSKLYLLINLLWYYMLLSMWIFNIK